MYYLSIRIRRALISLTRLIWREVFERLLFGEIKERCCARWSGITRPVFQPRIQRERGANGGEALALTATHCGPNIEPCGTCQWEKKTPASTFLFGWWRLAKMKTLLEFGGALYENNNHGMTQRGGYKGMFFLSHVTKWRALFSPKSASRVCFKEAWARSVRVCRFYY